jgi:3-oxoacyl-[acyl-carrier protein] reductase
MTTTTGASGPAPEFSGKVALVTGASRNIGRAIAHSLAAGGAAVAVNTRSSRDAAEKVVQEIRSAGGQAELFMADIADANAVKDMGEAILRTFGRVDFLVLNASVRSEKPFMDLTYEEWRVPLSISLDGAFHCVKACLPSMIQAGSGSIVMLGGMVALSGAARRVHGSVAKHGMVGMTRALAREFGAQGIRVNCVAPGQMNTTRAAGRTARGGDEMIPLGRKGESEEIATTVRFLCGQGASYVNGQTIHVNGGQMMF